jgi:hypothetical protein
MRFAERGQTVHEPDDTSDESRSPLPECARIARRDFLRACGVVALCGSGCSSLLSNAQSTHHLLTDPHRDEWGPILENLTRAVLAFDHPRFPAIAPAEEQSRLLEMFDLEDRDRFGSFRRALLLFNDISLFPKRLVPIIDAEHREYGASEADVHAAVLMDEQRFARFQSGVRGDTFIELPLHDARAYCRLWAQSGFGVKRKFCTSAKTIVVVSAYSLSPLWDAIGYEGPEL